MVHTAGDGLGRGMHGVRDMEVGVGDSPQNRSNPSVGKRKARSALVGQAGSLRRLLIGPMPALRRLPAGGLTGYPLGVRRRLTTCPTQRQRTHFYSRTDACRRQAAAAVRWRLGNCRKAGDNRAG